ncbi:MAG TPA: thiamine phosphate synthase [Nitrolancea sp.]|nr:thiamine phosphate synthase [Nitrolancea sp.]
MTPRGIPRFHLISDRRLCDLDRLPDVAARAVIGKVDAIHLRERDVAAGKLLEVARALRAAIGDAELFVNDRVDIALLSGADGVQLGETSISVSDARALAGDRLLIGRSVHDADGARRAYIDGADFVIAGHVYETASKAGQPGRGLEFITAIARVCPIPIIAVGGITRENTTDVVGAGAHGIAVVSGILRADNPESAALGYADVL